MPPLNFVTYSDRVMATESASISQKLEALIALTEQWDAALKAAAETNLEAIEDSEAATQALIATTEKAMISAQKLIDKTVEAGRAAETTAAHAQFQPTSGAAYNTFNSGGAITNQGAGYISGVSLLTKDQKTEFLRIVLDRDESALNKTLAEFQAKINAIYTDEYKNLKEEQQRIDDERSVLGAQVSGLLDSIKGKGGTQYYYNTIKEIEKLRANMNSLIQSSGLLGKRIGQYDESAQRVEGQMAVLRRAWDDDSMQRSLASGARGTEAQGYSKEELQWLVEQALIKGAGERYDSVALTELLNKINSAVPTKRYQLDLTVGDQKLSGFTDADPVKFIEALLRARGSAI